VAVYIDRAQRSEHSPQAVAEPLTFKPTAALQETQAKPQRWSRGFLAIR